MRQVQPVTLPKNSNFSSCLQISCLKITLPKPLQLKNLDFLQQTITVNENVQWQMIKDSVLFALSSGFSVSFVHFYLKKKSTRGMLFCISSFFSFHRSLYLLLAYCLYWRQFRSRDLSFNLFPVGNHVVEHFEVHQYVTYSYFYH